MPRYRLHCFAQSGNAYKVALYLTLAGLDWEPVFVDFFNGEMRSPAFRETVNELGEVPVLETGGRLLTQSGAILMELAEHTGHFAPEDRVEALRWILFDNHKFTSYLATYRFMRAFAKVEENDATRFLKGRIAAAMAIVEKHMATRDFVLEPRPTIVDLSMVGYLYYPIEEHGYDLAKEYPAIHRWTERIKALPGWKHPYELMPGHPIPGR